MGQAYSSIAVFGFAIATFAACSATVNRTTNVRRVAVAAAATVSAAHAAVVFTLLLLARCQVSSCTLDFDFCGNVGI